MWRWREPLLNCVRRKTRRRSLFRQLLIGMSTRRYLPASGTAGLDRSLVSGKSRVPAPPPMMTASTSRGRIFASHGIAAAPRSEGPAQAPGSDLTIRERGPAVDAVAPAGLHLALARRARGRRLPLPAVRTKAHRAVVRQPPAAVQAQRPLLG